MDADFHYLLDLSSRIVRDNTLPITIGDRVWIANRVSILKGVVIPNGCVVSIGSIVKRVPESDMYSENCILTGAPAKCIKTGVEYIGNSAVEQELGVFFKQGNASATKVI